ncbi:mpv17-like protein 2 isoform X2 [Taeniopygia guttata]|uniref:mpv17-like protein 2 isoform X2 n=1 Tax=Taeniopygia guttata TaxID=59729 RepID=UPI003BB91E16
MPSSPHHEPLGRCCPCRCHGGPCRCHGGLPCPRRCHGGPHAPVGVMAAQEAEVAAVTWCSPVPRPGGGSARSIPAVTHRCRASPGASPGPGAVPWRRMLRRSWRSLFSGRLLLLTNTLSCGGLLAAGDSLQQRWHRHRHPESPVQPARTGRMFVVGCSLGPPMHFWYLWLDAAFPARGARCLRTVLKKVLLDQLVASPSLGAWYFVAIGTLEGQTLQESWDELKEKFWELYKPRSASA